VVVSRIVEFLEGVKASAETDAQARGIVVTQGRIIEAEFVVIIIREVCDLLEAISKRWLRWIAY
jgi:hypothetical protein